ncbi:hypothetical protein MBLNU459_g2980t1 [Dothideomycetes sp. NU459]
MGKTFDVNVPFGVGRQSTVKGTQSQTIVRKPSKRQALQDFFRTNASKLRIKRSTKRQTKIDVRPSSRRSKLPEGSSDADNNEPAILKAWGAKSANDLTRTKIDSFTGSPVPSKTTRSEPKVLTQDDYVRMFSGAPEFDVAASRKHPRPRVTFRGKVTGGPEDARDFLGFGHSTFAATSLGGHRITKTLEAVPAAASQAATVIDPNEDLLEMPSMMSFAGRDPGTVGLEYFLQLPVSDSKLTEGEVAILAKRAELLLEPEVYGLRRIDVEIMIDRLSEIGDMSQSSDNLHHSSNPPNEQKAAEMYADLFAKLLSTPKFAPSSEDDPTGFDVQIAALTTILNTPGMWYDFSYVEWRIRLGQILWSVSDDQPSMEEEPAISERDMVLLQITLASELLLRLEMSGGQQGAAVQTRKVQWDLVLARQFRENVRIAPKMASEETNQNRKSVMSAISYFTANETFEVSQVEPILYPRHERQQLEGLLKFAERLQWPHVDEIKKHMKGRHQRLTASPDYSAYATPVATPGLSSNLQGGYFGNEKRPQVARAATAQSMQLLPASAYGTDSFDAGGWLSRSWLTGLVLPGEAASHFLISTLLENSPRAIEALGDSANLYGGFLYQRRSYWSKSCVVGRVLAAADNANDCMGWVSGPGASSKQADGWLNIEVKDLPLKTAPADAFGANSSFSRGKEPGSTTEADFTWPVDSPPVMGNEASYHGLSLLPTDTNIELSQEQNADLHNGLLAVTTSTVYLTFGPRSKTATATTTKTTVPLLHDVYFVSSYPCFPEAHCSAAHLRASASWPSPPPSPDNDDKQLPDPPCHPLHTGYAFETMPAAALLSDTSTRLERPSSSSGGGAEKTLVLDCRGSDELELLARAWCAKVGENALVGRMGRTCLSCCVREASGLGIRVVLRT